MSKPQSKIPSPARSLGAITPRRHRTRRTFSVASPARSDVSVRLSTVVEKFINNDKFNMSPMNRRSVLPDDTEIEAPRRASWWKRLEGSSRDVLEALDTNKMPDDLLVEEYEFEVAKDKQNQTVQESSDSESVASIIVPRRTLFNREKQPQAAMQSKFGEIMGSCKSLGRTNIEDVSIDDAPKNLFNKGPRSKPIFPAALLNSTNKTINKTVEPETIKKTRPNLFGRAGTKRKNMFTDLVLSDSEEDSEVQHKVFGFKHKRTSLGTRNRRMPSLTPSMTTEIDIDDWNLLPSSTMIGGPEVSRIITNKDIELAQEENQDKMLTEEDLSLNPETDLASKTKSIQNKSLHQTKQNSIIQNEDNDKTLTKENIEAEDPSKHQDIICSKSAIIEDKTLQNKSSKRNNDDEEVIDNIVEDQELNKIVMHRPLVEYEPSVEEAIAELHGETMEKDTTQRNSPSNTQNRGSYPNTHGKDKSGKIEPSPEVQESQMADISVKDKSEEEKEPSTEEQEVEDSSKEVTQENEDEDMKDVSEKDKSDEKIEPCTEEQEVEDSSKEVTQENEDEDMEDVSEKDKSEEEIEPSTEEQEVVDSSKEVTQENEDEDMEDVSEKEKSEEETEQSVEEQEDEESSKEASQEHHDEDIDDSSEKDRKNGQEVEDQESHNSSEEKSHENQDDDMEKMVWDDNDDEKSSDHVETEEKGEPEQEKSRKVSMASHASFSKNITNKSQKTGLSIKEDQVEQENDVIEETPNNSTHDTTGRNRKKELSQVKSPEVVLQNITKDNESFRPIGRSTTFRKSKSVIFDNMNVRTSLPPVQESTLGSEGSRNSGTEGSEWDSHRTTRKTIRQTFGRGFTPRKSLRALVMEQSAKRQTEHYNKTTANMTKNKSDVDDANENDASRINKTKNKTVVDDVTDRDASKINKTKNRTVTEDVSETNAATIDKTKNKTDRHSRVSNRNTSSNQLSALKSPVHETFTHHVSDSALDTTGRNRKNELSQVKSPEAVLQNITKDNESFRSLISERQMSYHESLQDINEPEISEQQISNHEAEQANNDSGPEISIHASYGQSMSAEYSERENLEDAPFHLEISDKWNKNKKEISQRDASVPKKSMHDTSEQEILDYEASENEQSEEEMSVHEVEEHSSQENAEHDDSVHELSEQSAQEAEKEDSEPEEFENEVEPEESEKGEFENEVDPEESEKEDTEPEEFDNEVEREESENQEQIEHESQEDPESEQESENEDHNMSQESVNDVCQQESDQESVLNTAEQPEQEVSDQGEKSQQEIESEQESENEDHDMPQESVNDVSQLESDQESVLNTAEQPEQEVSDQGEKSQQEIESEQESENEDHDMSQESVNDVSQQESDQESVLNTAEEPEQEISSDEENDHEDSDHFVSGLNSPHQMSNSNRTERVVFDNEISDQEIDYERSDRVSRQMTYNDSSEQVSREPTPEATASRISDHSRTPDVSVGSKRAMLLMQLEKLAQKNAEIRQKIAKKVENSLKPTRNFNFNQSPIRYKFSNRRINIPEPKKQRKPKPTGFRFPIETLPKQFVEDLKYKPPKRFSPANAPWITKRLYKFLETKLEPKYDYQARVRAEELVQNIYGFAKLVKRHKLAPQPAVDELKREMARLHIVNTHHEFYCFFHEFMPREIRIKVNPDVINKIPMPRNGVFGEILQARAAVE